MKTRAAVKNLGYSMAGNKLPIEAHAGVSYRLFRHFLFSGEFALPLYEPVYGALGAEFDIDKKIFLEETILENEKLEEKTDRSANN